ncbi:MULTISPECIES: AAA family ATPase [Bacillus cereus group]|uniref:deoxynucleotide monophosphate kinase family protein n=1 Tax=Bacillus cereus group TaxID=86661 RepID=UPI000BEBCF13|nr:MULTISPECIES: AAA family ATPase [Bacillus cereus group]PEF88569.1 adenylate kinase [Bacillus thuringiensis]PES54746.1 adenylate kinase [Bacillus thuringiensis]PFP03563.1 adenylate kinase [Bacillus thuringiensis]PFS55702.1 adenylate kinase [Bacillus thuringiensis]PGL62354.1 adenylate kinase [Bacillus thuringiensis]
MRNTVIIGIAGKMRTGKDTIARLMAKDRRGKFQRGAYADELKLQVDRKYGKQEGGKRRALLQHEGQEERKHDALVWIKRLQPKIDFLRTTGHNVVITDVRQQNEIDSLRSQGAYIIRVNVSDEIRKQRIIDAGDEFKEADFYHETETAIDAFEVDYEINNEGGLIQLVQQLDAILLSIDRREKDRLAADRSWREFMGKINQDMKTISRREAMRYGRI